MLNGPDLSLFCHDTSSLRGRSIFFPVHFSTSFKSQNIYFKKNHSAEAAKSNCLSLHCVKIHLQRIRSKRCCLQNWVFLHTLFLENKAQINKTNYTMMLFMSKQVSLPKISSILQKIKIGPKCYIRSFFTKAFNWVLLKTKTKLTIYQWDYSANLKP